MTGYEDEPIPGLPGRLPAGERILWQGSPDRRMLARNAFHTRLVAGYFAVLAGVAAAVAMSSGSYVGVGMTVALGIAAVLLLNLLAWSAARTTIYTLTNRRIVMRIGVAVPKCINLPLPTIASVDLAVHAGDVGDVSLTLLGTPRLGYLALWPHARPFRIARPQPMLRCVAEASSVAALVAHGCRAIGADRKIPAGQRAPAPALVGAQAA